MLQFYVGIKVIPSIRYVDKSAATLISQTVFAVLEKNLCNLIKSFQLTASRMLDAHEWFIKSHDIRDCGLILIEHMAQVLVSLVLLHIHELEARCLVSLRADRTPLLNFTYFLSERCKEITK